MKEWAADEAAGLVATEADVAAGRAADASKEDNKDCRKVKKMKPSGKTTLFALVCIAVLFASYGVGLGVRKIRFAGVEGQASADVKSEEPADESDEEAVAAEEGTSGPSEEVAAEPSADPDEEVAARPERPEGGRMRGEGMRERFQNMSEEERQEAMAQMRERGGRGRGGGGGEGEGRGGGAFSQLSEEDRDNLRAEMEALGAGEMSDEERQQARTEIFQKYGITPREGGGGRPGGGQGGGRRQGGRE
ncbi:MAG: hypothetical protein ISS70_04560 [Phycisphaerae bacterium]|nr:hypothetical protein [Phycisphaerae bacterium]